MFVRCRNPCYNRMNSSRPEPSDSSGPSCFVTEGARAWKASHIPNSGYLWWKMRKTRRAPRFLPERASYQVIHAKDGRQAQELADTIAPPDIVLLDVMLPFSERTTGAHLSQKA